MVIRRPVISGSSSAGRLSSAVSDIPMPRYFHYAGNYSGWNVGFLFFFWILTLWLRLGMLGRILRVYNEPRLDQWRLP